jgi:chromosome segregation ATPase
LFDVKKQLASLQTEHKQINQHFLDSKNKIFELESQNQSLLQQVERLKALVENLDKSKEELIKRL